MWGVREKKNKIVVCFFYPIAIYYVIQMLWNIPITAEYSVQPPAAPSRDWSGGWNWGLTSRLYKKAALGVFQLLAGFSELVLDDPLSSLIVGVHSPNGFFTPESHVTITALASPLVWQFTYLI